MTVVEKLSFEDKISYWKKVLAGEDTYGDETASSRGQGYQYWRAEMLGEIVARARKKSAEVPGRVDLLISISGFSPETTILSYELLKPDRVLVVNSESANESLDSIGEHIVGGGGSRKLNYRQFKTEECEPSNALSIYRIVKEELDRLKARNPDATAIIDITGGKKVMSATAALAAWQLNLRLAYIDSEFDPELRKPRPGSEHLIILANPTELFGHEELHATRKMFNTGAFDAAALSYGALADRLVNPSEARFMRDLSAMYRAWCDLNFKEMREYAASVLAAVKQPQFSLESIDTRRIEIQARFCSALAPENRLDMLFSYFLLGQHYSSQGRHDFAALLYYRTIEGCFAYRLENGYGGFLADEPDYSLLSDDEDALTAQYNEFSLQVFPRWRASSLPGKVGFMSGAGLLYVLDDELMKHLYLTTIEAMKYLFSLSAMRNRSVLAHGYEVINAVDSGKLAKQGERSLEVLLRLHAPGREFKGEHSELQFIKMGVE